MNRLPFGMRMPSTESHFDEAKAPDEGIRPMLEPTLKELI